MEKSRFEGKTRQEALEKALTSLNASEEELIINEKCEKAGLFKGKKVELEVILKQDVINSIKKFIEEITSLMNITIQTEIQKRDDRITISLYSDSNQILIGKNGKTIEALQTLVNQFVLKETKEYWKITIDVGGYKQKKQKNIEFLAKKLAKEVLKTKVPVKMDEMNSYERRLVHNILSTFEGIETKSEGEEPNRCVVIKPKEE